MWATAERPSPEPAVFATPPGCALLRDKKGAADILFQHVADRARRAGALQHDEPHPRRRCCDMVLTDLASDRRTPISWDRGDLAVGCRRDRAALTEAAERVERSIRATSPNLVILNKRGNAEAIVAALEIGAPVLIGVAPADAPALRDFAGDMCAAAEDEEGVSRWLVRRPGSFDGCDV